MTTVQKLAEPVAAHPIAIIPAALVSLSAVLLFGVQSAVPGTIALLAGVAGGLLTDRSGRSDRLGVDLALIALPLGLISLVSLAADISWLGVVRFGVVLSLAVIIPYLLSRYVLRDHSIRFPWRAGRWTPTQLWYLVVVLVLAYLLLPWYFLSSGVWENWPNVVEFSELARLFVGVGFVGLWDELFFVCIIFTLLRRHFRVWIANVLMSIIFVSFLWELGYQSFGPLLTIPFALVQGAIFQLTKNLGYVVAVHLLFDAIVFLVIVAARNPEWMWMFPLAG